MPSGPPTAAAPPAEEAAAFERWMREDALPLWATAGRTEDGSFHEALLLGGAPDAEAVRRVRVQFRQIYVYAAADLLGLYPGGAELAETAFETVRRRAWAPDGSPGWVSLLNPDGSVADPRRDAYDQAFALYGLAWLLRARPSEPVRRAISDTLLFVDGWIAARSGGWWEQSSPADPNGAPRSGGADLRRQNPHMHALEAMMALYEATGERAFLDRAREIYHLFAARFFDWTRGVVIEYFDLDWRPAESRRQRIEPGHMAEWVYLVREYERLTGESVAPITERLYANIDGLGLDPSKRFLVDELDDQGRATLNRRRLWPQTERLKAQLAEFRATGDEARRAAAAATLRDIRAEYLAGAAPGGWRDAFDLSGALVADRMPASTLYHLFSAFALGRDLFQRRPARAAAASNTKARPMIQPTTAQITPVVLAGGTGSRLWPLSKPETPKQFLRLTGGRTLLQETLSRVEPGSGQFAPAMLVASASHAEVIAEQAGEIGAPLCEILLEPLARNSAPAIAAAAERIAAADPDGLMLILPADHLIRETTLFRRLVENAAEAAQAGLIVTFGITPTRAETGYGYIRAGAPIGAAGAFEVDAFVEKPDVETARRYLASGSYLWNSGMFLFRAGDLLRELDAQAPQIRSAAADAVAKGVVGAAGAGTAAVPTLTLDADAFGASPSDSIDYAVMEKTEKSAVCPAPLTWSDIGSWDALAAALASAEESDAEGNLTRGAAALLGCEGVYARSEGPRIAAIGLKDVVIVATADTILVTAKESAQRVKEIAALLPPHADGGESGDKK